MDQEPWVLMAEAASLVSRLARALEGYSCKGWLQVPAAPGEWVPDAVHEADKRRALQTAEWLQ